MSRLGQTGNLGPELNSFIGRRRELSQVRQLLADFRLVTLTGIGGTGKTRLARQIGLELRRAFPDGVWFVDLAQLGAPGQLGRETHDPDLLAFIVADVLRLPDDGTGSALRTLVGRLTDCRMLLILDNCEPVIPACATVIGALLRGCPQLKVLTTSRESLAVAGEAVFPVPPLSTPDVGRPHRGGEADHSDAVTLFVERARQTVPGFTLDADNGDTVARLCDRLDGLPLAIELAAARLRVLAPAQLLDRLTDRFAVLGRGHRDAPARQQTLTACMDWSFELCAKPERLLWTRASVFVGGFELDAAEGVCTDGYMPGDSVLAVVAGLVDRSILIRDDTGGDAARYRMLETIRAYGQDGLAATGELSTLQSRHRDWYQRLVARARDEWVGDRQAYWLGRLGREHANVRAAIEYCLARPGEADTALRIVTDLPLHYWYTRGAFGEGRRWVDLALAGTSEVGPLHARGLLISSQLAIAQADHEAGIRLLTRGEDLARRLSVPTEIGHAVSIRGMGELFSNQPARAAGTLDAAWSIVSAAAEPDWDLRMNLLMALGVAAALADDQARVGLAAREIDAIVQARGGTFYRAAALWFLAIAAFVRGDLDEAAARATDNLELAREWAADNPNNLAVGLEVMAWISAGQQQYRRAAVLLGAAANAFSNAGGSLADQAHFTGHHEVCEQRARQALGDRAFADAFRHGRTRTLDHLLADIRGRQPVSATPAPGPSLTPREHQVAELLARGLSNKDIAAALVIAPRTAESHVEHIMAKLACTSRAQVAAWVAAQGA